MTRTYTREEWQTLTPEERGSCDEYTGYCDKVDGYGRTTRYWSGTTLTRRIAWVESQGLVPLETPCVLRHCDNPLCRNVSHMFLGTNADNVADRVEKGRSSGGHNGGTA